MKKFFFPCNNGISCYSKEMSVAFIDSTGSKCTNTCHTKNKIIFFNIPFLRGVQYFFCGLIALFSTFLNSYRLTHEKNSNKFEKFSKKLGIGAVYFGILLAILVGIIFAILLFGFLPTKISFWLIGSSANLHLRGLIIGMVKVAFFFLILLGLRFLPFMQEFYRFNSICNKFYFKEGKNNENFKKTLHFPLNFLVFLIFTLLLATFVVSLIAVRLGFWLNSLVLCVTTLGAMMVGYELLYLCTHFCRGLAFPISWFVCLKPTITQEEIYKVVMLENSMGAYDEKIPKGEIPLSAVITEMETKLAPLGDERKSDIDWIIATVLNLNRSEIKLVRSISQQNYNDIMHIAERRAKGEPLSSIFGYVDFYGYKIDVNKKVLSPRMETEILVDEALKAIKNIKNCEVCDLCTGSGAIAIVVAKESHAKVTAIDISKQALLTAQNNAKKFDAKIEFVESDLFKNLKKSKKFDIIVSNPPYIPSGDISSLSGEVKNYDPHLALDGGQDGLDFYRKICADSPSRLKKGGQIFLEIGINQAKDVRALLKANGFSQTKVIKDYNKIERVIYGKIDK